MPKDMTTQQLADLSDPLIPKVAIWICTLELGSATLRFCDQVETLSYDGETYEPQLGKWEIPDEVSTGTGLVPENVDIVFDGADRYVAGSLFARIFNDTWHMKNMQLACLVYNATTGAFITEAFRVHGFIDQLKNPEASGSKPKAPLSCETGTFRLLSHRQVQVSDASQRARDPNDGFMRNAGIKGGENIPFGIADSKIPGA